MDWGSSFHQLLDAFTVLILVLALFATRQNTFENSRVLGKRATLDLIEKSENTSDYRDALAVFHRCQENNQLSALHAPDSTERWRDRAAVLRYLNHYELISIGLRDGFLDEGIYRKWMETNFLADWNNVADFIQRERWKHDEASDTWFYRDRLFENYQAVATVWAKQRGVDIISISAEYAGPPSAPAGHSDVVQLYTRARVPFARRRAAA
ncbi:MAG: DUF4760 domain-containing protein [Pseudomonadota bacterium]